MTLSIGVLLWFVLKFFVFVLVIGVLVLVHEFGHFIVAKWCGVGVLKFAVGFGPAILRFRRGETIYQIGAIPLGGFVRMIGDIPDMITGPQDTDDAVREEEALGEDEELAKTLLADRSRWFIEKSLLAKSAIVAAGPIFNFIFAFFVAAFCGFLYGEEFFVEGPIIGDVIKNSPGEQAGLKTKDEVLKVDGLPVAKWVDFAKSIHDSEGKTLFLEVKRGAETLTLSAKPQSRSLPGPDGKRTKMFYLGLSPATRHEDRSFVESFGYGYQWVKEKTELTYLGLWEMMAGHASTKDLAGPLFIFQEAGRQAARGLESLFYFMAIISVSLAVLNLLPIPVLDGGHLLFFFLEAIIGPISIRKKEVAQQVGMVLLLCLMVFALKNDVVRKAPAGDPDWNSIVQGDEAANPDADPKASGKKEGGAAAGEPASSPAK